jgi:hypothetical protein
VKTSKEWKRQKKEEKQRVLSALREADTSGDGQVTFQELVAFLQQPAVKTLLDQLAGAPSETHAQMLAQTLMAKFDADRSGSLSTAEISLLKKELESCITEPFYTFIGNAGAAPGGVVWGMVVMQLEKPLAAREVQVRLEGAAECHFSVPKTHHRTVQRDGRTHTESYTKYHPKHAKHIIVDGTQTLHTPPDGILQPGLHRFRFSFQLPPNTPFSLKTPSVVGNSPNGNGMSSQGRASISYWVTARTQPVMRSDLSRLPPDIEKEYKVTPRAAVTVSAPAVPELCPRGVPQFGALEQDAKSKPCCCCCCMNASKLPSMHVNYRMYSTTGLYSATNTTRRPVFAPGDDGRVEATIKNTHDWRDISGVQLTAGFHVNMYLRASGCSWYATMPLLSRKSEKIEIKAGHGATLSVEPTFTGPLMTCDTKAVTLTPAMFAKIRADAGTCASWKGLEPCRHDLVSVPSWTHAPPRDPTQTAPAESYQSPGFEESKGPDKSHEEFASSKTGPQPAMPDPAQEKAVADALFGAPVTEPTVSRGVNAPSTAMPSAPPAPLNDVYSYPGPNPYMLETSTHVVEDEEEFPQSALV